MMFKKANMSLCHKQASITNLGRSQGSVWWQHTPSGGNTRQWFDQSVCMKLGWVELSQKNSKLWPIVSLTNNCLWFYMGLCSFRWLITTSISSWHACFPDSASLCPLPRSLTSPQHQPCSLDSRSQSPSPLLLIWGMLSPCTPHFSPPIDFSRSLLTPAAWNFHAIPQTYCLVLNSSPV